MAASRPDDHRVIVVAADARVRTALAALIEATSGLTVVATYDDATHAGAAVRTAAPDVAVVDLAADDQGLADVAALTPLLPVVAVSSRSCAESRAAAAGATCFCDQDGDADGLSARVLAVARGAASAREGRTA